MIRIHIIILLIVPEISGYGFVEDSLKNNTNPCKGSWELSYQHPFITLADSLWDRRDFKRASSLYEIAAKKFTEEKNWKGLVKTMNRISLGFLMAREYDTVLSILQRNSEIIFEHLNNDRVELADVYFNMGVCYDYLRKVDSSLTAHKRALEIRRNIYGDMHIDVSKSYQAIGEMLWYNQRFINAKEYLFQRAAGLPVLYQFLRH